MVLLSTRGMDMLTITRVVFAIEDKGRGGATTFTMSGFTVDSAAQTEPAAALEHGVRSLLLLYVRPMAELVLGLGLAECPLPRRVKKVLPPVPGLELPAFRR
jgi:hypothetical protein